MLYFFASGYVVVNFIVALKSAPKTVKMKRPLTEPRLHYFVLSSLILLFPTGVTSQDITVIKKTAPDTVVLGTQINFIGNTTSATSGSLPTSFSFFVKNKNELSFSQFCNVDYGACGTPAPPCYCIGKSGDTYSFKIQDTATFARSEAEISGDIGGSNPIKYPKVIAPITTKPPTTGPTTETTTGAGDHTDHTGEIVGGVCGGLAGIALGICIYCICKKKKVCCWKGAPVTSDQPSDSPAEEASTVHSTNHNALTSSKPEDKVEMTGEKKKKKSKKSTNAGSPKKKKKDFENGEKKMDENEPRCLPQPEPVAEPGLSTSLSNPEALKSNFATTRLSSPPSNTRPTSIEMTSAPRPLPSPRNPNM